MDGYYANYTTRELFICSPCYQKGEIKILGQFNKIDFDLTL